MQSKDIILRLQGTLGMFRLNTNDTATFQEFKKQAADLMKADIGSISFRVNGSRLTQSSNDALYRIRGIE